MRTSLIWHQFRKDLRLFRVGLAFWCGLLAVDLTLNLLLPGWIEFDPLLGFNQGMAFFAGWIVFLLWLGALLLPAAVVMTDSPLRENAFVRTRPVPRGAIVWSKLLFIAGCILAPACLVEIIHLLAIGSGPGRTLHAAGERLLFLAPAVLAAAAFGGLWRNPKELVVGWLVFGGCTWLGFLGVYFIAGLLEALGLMSRWIDDPLESRLLVWEMVALAGLVFVLWLAWGGRMRPARRWLAMPLVTLLAGVVGFLPSWNLFPVRAQDPGLAKSLFPGGVIQLDWDGFQLNHNGAKPDGRIEVGGSLRPGTPRDENALVIDWAVRDAVMEQDSDDSVEFDYTGRIGEVFNWRSGLSEQDLRAFEPLFGEEPLFLSDHGAPSGGGMANLGRVLFDLLPTNRARIHANLEGRAFRWSAVARLPLQPGASVEDEAGSWAIVGIGSRGGQSHTIGLRRDQIALRTTRDAAWRRLHYWPTTQHEFLFVDSQRRIVLLQNSPVWTSMGLGSHTGVAHYFLALELALPSLLQSEPPTDLPEDLELWVLRRDYVGDLQAEASTPEFELASLRSPSADVNQLQSEGLDEAAFRRRVEEIVSPAPDASRVVVATYVVQVLRLIEARRAFIQEGDPIVTRLAALVPQHLDLFLDALPYAENLAARTLRHAIRRGTSEAQASEVIAALPGDPELAEVVLARGWETLAAPTAKRLATSPAGLPFEVTQLLALSADPSIRHRLLVDFQQRPSTPTYEILRTFDGIEPDLAAALDAIWANRRRVLRPEMDSMRPEGMLLRVGRREALERILRVFHLAPDGRRDRLWNLLDACYEGIVMDGLDDSKRHDHEVLAAWLKDKQASDFEWDPNRRRWVLRSTDPAVAQP